MDPCTLTFEGGLKDITKAEKLIKKSLAVSTQQKTPVENKCATVEKRGLSGHEDEPSGKKTRTGHLDFETESILNGAKLTDLHVHAAQQLLKRQFPHLVFSQQSFKPRRVSESGSPYLTNFRLYIPVETTGLLHRTLAAKMVL